jgi:hypothetical protein
MSIKEILLNGGTVKFDYKESENDWVGEASIHYFSGGYGLESKIIVTIPCREIHGRAEYSDLDEAIDIFMKLVFRDKNIMIGNHQAMIELEKEGHEIDLDRESDRDLLEQKKSQLKREGKIDKILTT